MIALAVMLAAPSATMVSADIAGWDGLPIPDAVGVLAARYITCLSDPVLDGMESGEPRDKAAAQAMMDKTLADCRAVRVEVIPQMDAKLTQTPGWTDPAVRHAKIARMLDAVEERVGYTALNREDFSAMAENLRRCMDTGRKDCADEAKRQMPPARKVRQEF